MKYIAKLTASTHTIEADSITVTGETVMFHKESRIIGVARLSNGDAVYAEESVRTNEANPVL
jgi:hypothetical protein